MKKEMIIDLLSEAWSICEDSKYFDTIDEMHCFSDAENLIFNLKSLPDAESNELPDAESNELPDVESLQEIFKEPEKMLK